nr:unnamed protein product [Digitaria exilis]
MAMLLRRRLPLVRLLRQLHTDSVASASSSSAPPPPLPKPHAAASPSVAPGSRRLGFLNPTPLASARAASASSSAAAYLAVGAAAALASLPVAYADGNEQGPVGPAVSTDPTEGEDLARKERKRIMELAQSRGMQRGSYPQFDVAVKGQKVVVKFNMPSTCNISHLIVDLVTHIGLEAEQHGGGSEVLVRAWDREIEDTILLALQSPEVYDDIARGTRCKFETNRPRAVLFEGPPGTGKTSSARVIAKQAGVPLLYVPLEVVMSKYYGESERLLGSVFSLANDLPDGGIIFLDEVDSFAIARDSEMHEATRRILSVILRQIDGFEQDRRVVVIAATNRKEDLDPALIRCIFLLVMSGRDIRDVCQQAERHWASKVCRMLIRGQVPKDEKGEPSLPPIDEYVSSAEQRRKSLPDRTRWSSRSPALKLA